MNKIILKKEKRIAVITINRPKVKNALDLEAYDEFANALEDAKADSDIRVILINGAGDSFCTGIDLKFAGTLKDMTPREVTGLIKRLQAIFRFEDIEKPVVSAVNGYALGNGCDIALASDFVIAADNAMLGMTYTNLGLIPDLGGTFRLPRIVGLAKAREMILTGENINAEEALRIGLVNRVVPAGGLMDAAIEFAAILAQRAPIALAMAKAAINKGLSSDLASAQDFEAYIQNICLQSRDVTEAVRAFLEKRSPDFKGE
jgi:enoyl-CoA hydratase